MEMAKELLILFGRVMTIVPLLLLMTLMMGKRSIAELPVFDFLIVIILGAVVGADIADPDISHIHTAVAIVLIGVLQIVVAKWKISNRKIGRLLTFEPTIVIQDGKFLTDNIYKERYSLDNMLQMLRKNGVFDVSEVETGILEGNGQLPIHKKPAKSSVSIEDMGVSKVSPHISYPVIVEGQVYEEVLQKLNLDRSWLEQELKKMEIMNMQAVYFASVNAQAQLHISLKNETQEGPDTQPPLVH